MTEFTERVLQIISSIPKGHVMTYQQAAAAAGNGRAARQVSRILHSMSRKYKLPWYRVINSKGKISLHEGRGLEEQRALLQQEGVEVDKNCINLSKYLWVKN